MQITTSFAVFVFCCVGWEANDMIRQRNTGQMQVRFMLIAIHTLCWLVFLSLPAIFNPRLQGGGLWGFISDMSQPPRWTNALLLIAVFYTNYLYAIPRLYFMRRYMQFASVTVGFFIAFLLLNYLQRPSSVEGELWLSVFGNSFNLFMLLIVYLVSFVLCLTALWQKVKDERWNTKVSVVTERLSPHILFNTLNSIYALALAKSDEVPGAIVRFSKTLRYTMDEGENVVLLEKEIAFLRDYAELEKLRLPADARFRVEIDSNLPVISVQRFLLIPLVESAFRCSAMAESNSVVEIDIRRVDNELVTLLRCNSVPGTDVGTAFSVKQIQARLDLLYPGNYHLELIGNGPIFVVTLRIRLS